MNKDEKKSLSIEKIQEKYLGKKLTAEDVEQILKEAAEEIDIPPFEEVWERIKNRVKEKP